MRELQNPKAFARAQMNPIQFFAGHGIHLAANIQYEIRLDDEKLMNFVLPFDRANELGEEQLNRIVAAQEFSKTSTVSSVGTALTASSLSSQACIGTAIPTSGTASIIDLCVNFFERRNCEYCR